MIPALEELIQLTPAYVRRESGIAVPDAATDIRVHRDRIRHRPTGEPVKKLIPDERYSGGIFSRRNPTYIEIEDQHYVSEVPVSWRVGDETFMAWALLKDPR